MKLNLNHANDYLVGYSNLETRREFATDKLVDSYVIGVVSTDQITEIIANVGTFEYHKNEPSSMLKGWHDLVANNCTIKIKALDIYVLAGALAKNLLTIEQFSQLIKGSSQIFDTKTLVDSVTNSGFIVDRVWYGPYQWVVNIQARKI